MAILSVLARLFLDKTGFDAGLAAADRSISKFGSNAAKALGIGFGAAAVGAFAKSVIDLGSNIKDMSDRLGISVEQLQDFKLAAELGGAEIDTFASAIEKMRKATAEGKGLGLFGISDELMRSGDPGAVFRALADDIEKVGLNAERTKQLLDVFGKGAGKLVPALFELKNVSGEPKFSTAEAGALDEAGDAFTKFKNRTKIFAFRFFNFLGASVGEAGTEFARLSGRPLAGPSNAPSHPPTISDVDLQAAERAEHMAEQDRALALEKAEEQKKREEHMAEQDRALTLEKQRLTTEREGHLRAGTQSAGGLAGIFVGGLAGASVPGKLDRANDTLMKMEKAMTTRGIVVRDKID